ncbi:FAD-binding oxidoreductase [Pelagibius litoralis]|uniref:FAD-binding oxidoreductase n=2 Tax=Pelagibius litoralis TaxID=374515 RepID=A0A967EXS8_9PROT|nr:FAD-binding oxidoreductase [Pelagibius litoralis]
MIANERAALADSLWAATANPSPERPPLHGEAEADTVVIGGGFTGLSAALHLAEAGKSVVLLEAETPGWGASGRNGGQVNPGLKATPEETEARFGPDLGRRMVAMSGGAGDLVFDLIARHGIQCAASRCGWIRAATTPKALATLQEIGRQWRDRGAVVDALDADEMERLLGTRAYPGGLIDRRGGNLHPLNYALGLAEAAERAGARIHGHSRVSGVQSTDDSVTVSTPEGRVTARAALICTNAYTGGLAAPLGQSVIPVTSVQVATEPLSDKLRRTILPEGHAPSDTRRLLLYFRKDDAGRFVMGGRGALGDGSIGKRQAALREAAVRLYPQLEGVRWRYAWGGDVALTRDHAPGLHLIAPRVMAGLGYNGRGVGMATAMGRVLAEWAQGRPGAELDFPITAARPIPFHRFRRIALGATVAAFRMLDRVGI